MVKTSPSTLVVNGNNHVDAKLDRFAFQFFEYEHYIFPFDNQTSVQRTSMRKNAHYHLLYTVWSKFLILEIIPYVTIITLNAFIVTKIYESLKFRGKFEKVQGDAEVRRKGSDISIRQDLDSVSPQTRMNRPRAR